MDLADFEAAGLLDGAPSDRAALLEWLVSLGLDVDTIVAASQHRQGLGAVASDLRIMPGERMARSAALDRSGLPAGRFDALSRALGFGPLATHTGHELGYTADEVDLVSTLDHFGAVFSTEELLALARLLGGVMARIGDAMVSSFLTDVEDPHLESGGGEYGIAQSSYAAAGLLDGFAARLDPLLRRHVLQAVQRRRDATDGRAVRFAVGFVDLVGFTERSGRMDESSLARFIRNFEARAHDVTTASGAQVVKLIGDEVMFVATSADASCRAALALTDAFDREHGPPVLPRGGIAFGPVLARGGDYYGSVVNLASRLADHAVPEEVLVDRAVTEASADAAFTPAGRRMVKGFGDPVEVWSLETVRPSPGAQ